MPKDERASLNPGGGRPKDRKLLSFVQQLRNAVETVGRRKRKQLMQHAVEQAYVDNTVLIALLKKLIPDLHETDINLTTFEHFRKQKEEYGFITPQARSAAVAIPAEIVRRGEQILNADLSQPFAEVDRKEAEEHTHNDPASKAS